jgi:hypothetical protein
MHCCHFYLQTQPKTTSRRAGFSSTQDKTGVLFMGDIIFVAVLQQHVTSNKGQVAAELHTLLTSAVRLEMTVQVHAPCKSTILFVLDLFNPFRSYVGPRPTL